MFDTSDVLWFLSGSDSRLGRQTVCLLSAGLKGMGDPIGNVDSDPKLGLAVCFEVALCLMIILSSVFLEVGCLRYLEFFLNSVSVGFVCLKHGIDLV